MDASITQEAKWLEKYIFIPLSKQKAFVWPVQSPINSGSFPADQKSSAYTIISGLKFFFWGTAIYPLKMQTVLMKISV